MTMNAMPFASPFRVHFPGGLEHLFLNVYDALDFLENEWPIRGGRDYERARLTCQAALDGRESSVSARNAVLDACREAGLCCGGEKGMIGPLAAA